MVRSQNLLCEPRALLIVNRHSQIGLSPKSECFDMSLKFAELALRFWRRIGGTLCL
ncbi:hypothetical protein CBM2631_A300083 [Cupriavidus taiwanensis]|nr:hypothetical protein CBM2631_A300083 [Cupriavidus taiwanensis]SPD44631.1 protein of unknown function [Cupriavidus taiwanensis]